MSPAKNPPRAVTPGSVKVLMLVEAAIIGFLGFWLMNEFFYNAYFRTYLDQVLTTHLTTYTAALGLGIGLAGSAIAATFYRSLQHAKNRLETIVTPKIRSTVDKILSSLPTLDESQPVSGTKHIPVSQSSTLTSVSRTTAIIPLPPNDEKQDASG